MNTNTHRHRHFVALPMLLLVVGISITDAQGDVSRVLSNISDIQDAEAYSDSVYGAKGVRTITIGNLTATIFDGGAYITEDNNIVTIAALTSPVFVTHGDQRMIVPIGMQWSISENAIDPLTAGFDEWMHARTVSPLPEHFLAEHTIILNKAKLSVASTLPKRRDSVSLDPISLDSILLPVQLAYQKLERAEHILGVVRTIVESKDSNRFTEFVHNDEVASVIDTVRGREVLATLLGQTDADTAMQMEILVRIADDEAVWAIASFHPDYRDVAWSLIGPVVSVESQLMRVFLFPFGLFTSDSVSDFIFERYAVTLEGMILQVGDSQSFIDHLLDVHLKLVDRLEAKGYPARASHMADILIDLIQSVDDRSETMDNALRYLVLSSSVDLSPISEKVVEAMQMIVEPELDLEPLEILHPDEAEARTRAMLQDSGALFTVRTGIAAYADNKVQVSDIFFPSPTEDRSVTFTLDVITKIVSEIEIDGQSDFPYAPSFDGFVEWISQ